MCIVLVQQPAALRCVLQKLCVLKGCPKNVQLESGSMRQRIGLCAHVCVSSRWHCASGLHALRVFAARQYVPVWLDSRWWKMLAFIGNR